MMGLTLTYWIYCHLHFANSHASIEMPNTDYIVFEALRHGRYAVDREPEGPFHVSKPIPSPKILEFTGCYDFTCTSPSMPRALQE